MVTVSLDTSVLIDLLRQRDTGVMNRFSEHVLSGAPIMISAMVVHELETGIADGNATARRHVQIATLLAQGTTVDFTIDDSRASGRLRGILRASGTPIGEIDTLIAGQALARGWTVVTRNVKHFGRVDGLSLIDWSEGTEPLSPERIAARVAGET